MPSRGKLSNPPLIYVLAQVRFSTIKKMGDYVPDIQEALRQSYPRYMEQQHQTVELGIENVERTIASRWVFIDRDQQTAVILSDSFVVLESRSYDTYDQFAPLLENVLSTIKHNANITLAERIGIRYVDLIRESDGVPAIDNLDPSLRGIHPTAVDASSMQFTHIMRSRTSLGHLQMRVTFSDDGVFLPHDLNPSELRWDIDLKEKEKIVVLDIDHFITDLSDDFEPPKLIGKIEELHDAIGDVFNAAVTQEAYDRWREGAKQ